MFTRNNVVVLEFFLTDSSIKKWMKVWTSFKEKRNKKKIMHNIINAQKKLHGNDVYFFFAKKMMFLLMVSADNNIGRNNMVC